MLEHFVHEHKEGQDEKCDKRKDQIAIGVIEFELKQ